jgi:hypothetical protein
VLKVSATWDMRTRTSADEVGGMAGVGRVVSWRLLAGPRCGRVQARIVGGIADAMVFWVGWNGGNLAWYLFSEQKWYL